MDSRSVPTWQWHDESTIIINHWRWFWLWGRRCLNRGSQLAMRLLASIMREFLLVEYCMSSSKDSIAVLHEDVVVLIIWCYIKVCHPF